MTDERRIEFLADEAILRDAVRFYIWRRGVVAEKLIWAIVAAMACLFLWLLAQGRRDWLVWVVGAAILVPIIVVLLGWFVLLRQKLRHLSGMPSRRGSVVLGNDGIRLVSDMGESAVPWASVTEYWQRPGYWMIFLAPNQFFTLPLAGIAPDDLAALKADLDHKAGR